MNDSIALSKYIPFEFESVGSKIRLVAADDEIGIIKLVKSKNSQIDIRLLRTYKE